MKATELQFPWGQLGLYMAILFWVIALASGSVGAYDIRPSGFAALGCFLLFDGAIIFGGVGLARSRHRDRLLAGLALLTIIAPLALIMVKS